MLTLSHRPIVPQHTQTQAGFYVSDDEKRQIEYGLHYRPLCVYTEEICRYARMLRRGEMVQGELPLLLSREQEYYLRGKIKDIEENLKVLLTVDINGTDLRIVRR